MRMRRNGWSAAVVLVVTAVAVAGPVHAQTDVPPTLQAADLPSGFVLEGPPSSRADEQPFVPVLEGCVVSWSTRFPQPAASSSSVSFTNPSTRGTGTEEVWTFADVTAAQSFYATLAAAFTEYTKCKTVGYRLDEGGRVPDTVLGKFKAFDVGPLGEERVNMSGKRPGVTPKQRSMFTLFRDGGTVVVLEVTGVSKPTFTQLAFDAAERLAAT